MRADPLGSVGRWPVRTAALAVQLTLLIYIMQKAILLERGRGVRLVLRTFLQQLYFTAGQALPILSVASLSIGAAVFIMTTSLMGKIGAWNEITPFSETLLLRLVPLVTVLVVIARSGTAMATELGTMKVNREDEVLDSMAINLHYYVILPRFLAMIASLLLLNLYDFALARLGGEWLGRRLGLVYTQQALPPLLEVMGSWSVSELAIKSILFGAAISLLSCHYGLSVTRAPIEVPRMATRAVILSIFACLVLNLAYLVFFPASVAAGGGG